MNITIKEADPTKDTKGIQEVFYHTWIDTYPNEEHGITLDDVQDRYKDALTEETIAKRTKALSELGPDTKFFVAEDAEKVIGLCIAIVHSEKNQLQAIYILPEYQGKGIGKSLWQEALKFFDPAKDIEVDVAVYNSNAIGFYKKLGFMDTGKRFTEERFRMKSGSIITEMEMIKKAVA